jgi:HNH endonuclease
MTDDYLDKAEQRLTPKKDVDTATGCWNFTGTLTSNGYGHMSFHGESEYTHRISAVIYLNFDLDSGLVVMHICDKSSCFNPDHLKIGTQLENMQDAVAKGRMSNTKKMTTAQVAEVKYLLTKGDPYRQLALRFGVSTSTIGQIARGETWRDVAPREETHDPSELQELESKMPS